MWLSNLSSHSTQLQSTHSTPRSSTQAALSTNAGSSSTSVTAMVQTAQNARNMYHSKCSPIYNEALATTYIFHTVSRFIYLPYRYRFYLIAPIQHSLHSGSYSTLPRSYSMLWYYTQHIDIDSNITHRKHIYSSQYYMQHLQLQYLASTTTNRIWERV